MEKRELIIPYRSLTYGKKYDVTLKEAKKAFLSGMGKKFRSHVKVRFVRKYPLRRRK